MPSALTVIGGDFAIAPHDFVSTDGAGSVWPQFPGKRTLRCDSGRSALMLAIMHWRGNAAHAPEIWLPNFLCPSVQAAARYCGLTVRFYEDGPAEALPFSPPTPQENDLVVVVHYFGHTNRRALNWLRDISSRRWRVIEDCVQAPYNEGIGVSGEYAITSLRKWWSAPDGASVHLADEVWNPPLSVPSEAFVSRRLTAKLLRSLGPDSETQYLELTAASEACLDEISDPKAVSWVSEALLASGNLAAAAERRRNNWEFLLRSLSATQGWGSTVFPLHSALAPNAVPLVFVVCVPAELRSPLQASLAAKRIFCPIHWRLENSESTGAATLASSVLSLPIDQRYDEVDMQRLADAFIDFFWSNRS